MKKYKQLLICLAVMIVISALGLGIYFSDHTAVPMSYNEFLASVDQGIVTIVTFSPEDDYLEVRKKDDDTNYKVPNPRTEDFTEFLLTNNVDIRRGMVAEASGPLQFLAIVGIAGAVFYFFRKNKKGLLIEDSGLQAAYTLADIAGNAEAKSDGGRYHFIYQDTGKIRFDGCQDAKGDPVLWSPGHRKNADGEGDCRGSKGSLLCHERI